MYPTVKYIIIHNTQEKVSSNLFSLNCACHHLCENIYLKCFNMYIVYIKDLPYMTRMYVLFCLTKIQDIKHIPIHNSTPPANHMYSHLLYMCRIITNRKLST